MSTIYRLSLIDFYIMRVVTAENKQTLDIKVTFVQCLCKFVRLKWANEPIRASHCHKHLCYEINFSKRLRTSFGMLWIPLKKNIMSNGFSMNTHLHTHTQTKSRFLSYLNPYYSKKKKKQNHTVI